MKHNFLKSMLVALLITVAVPCVNAQVAHIGDILCEGDQVVSPANFNASTHTPVGVVFYVDNTGKHGWAIDLQDAGGYKWGPTNNDTPLTNYSENARLGIYDLNGYLNTQKIYAAYSNDTIFNERYPAFHAVDFENGWYLPTIGQLNYLYGNLIEVNASLYMAGGVPFETGISWTYWSSTEINGSNAWTLSASGTLNGSGASIYTRKTDNNHRVRAAHNFSIGQ